MKTLLALTVAATLLGTGLAIKCYVCNSHNEKDCHNIGPNNGTKYLEECGNTDDGHQYTLCWKIIMALDMDFGPLHPAENRVHRACGMTEEKGSDDCYYKSGYNTRSWVCACKGDGCNSASLPSTAALLMPLAALVAVLRGVN